MIKKATHAAYRFTYSQYLFFFVIAFKKLAWFLVVMFLTNVLLSGQSNTFQQVIDETNFRDRMEILAIETETIISDFVQEKHLSFMNAPIITKGRFYFHQNHKLRWEYIEPFQYLVILNGTDLWIEDEGHINTIDLKSNKTYQKINEVISESLQGKIEALNKDFDYELLENKVSFLLKLRPKEVQMQTYLIEIEVYFDKKDGAVSKVVMQEMGGDATHITFQNKKINEPLKAEVFELK